ncbi:A-kinase anchor protein 1, mitochondrial-like [Rhopilema esculentum]|uniref:A-kinase anchor protein 1, mitochondrial-like n=1 Tax=Rhopilema esculentum TaxID=499914 RepID=UPI0031D45D5F
MVLLSERTSLLETVLTMSDMPHEKDGGGDPMSCPLWNSGVMESTELELEEQGAIDRSTIVISTEFVHAGSMLTAFQSMGDPSKLPLDSLHSRPQSCFDNYQAFCIAATYYPGAVPVESPSSEVIPPYHDIPPLGEVDACDHESWMSRMSCLKLLDRSKSSRRCQFSRIPRDTWVFEFPQELCGRLIGKGGRTIQSIMQDSGTYLTLCSGKMNASDQVLKITGTENQILKAIKIIDSKFSSDVKAAESRVLPLTRSDQAVEVRQVQIPTDKEVDVVIANILNAGHLYLAMPRLAAVGHMNAFEKEMAKCYSLGHIPKMDRVPLPGTYCVAKSGDKWVRIQVVSSFAQSKKVEAILVDYGTYVMFPISSLRKIRADFLEMPFLAVECCLANIIPLNGDLFFSMTVTNLFQTLTENRKLKAVARASTNGVQYVELFIQEDNKLLSINRRLVACGAAQWIDM